LYVHSLMWLKGLVLSLYKEPLVDISFKCSWLKCLYIYLVFYFSTPVKCIYMLPKFQPHEVYIHFMTICKYYHIRWKIGMEFILAVWWILKIHSSNWFCPMHVKCNSIYQYKMYQSLRKGWFAKLNSRQIFILNGI